MVFQLTPPKIQIVSDGTERDISEGHITPE